MRTSPLRRLMQSIRHQATSTRPDARQRGSVLVLASVIVVLLALLGASYVQMARVDRRSTQALDNRSQEYEGSIIRFIGNLLRADIFNDDFEYLTTGTATGSPEIEKFDYPWTNPAEHRLVIERWLGQATGFVNAGESINTPGGESPLVIGTTSVTLANGTTVNNIPAALGGSGDDHWLAAIEPDFTTGVWPHLSNVTGTNLDLSEDSIDNIGAFAGSPDAPEGVPHVYASAPFATGADQTAFGVTDVPIADMIANPNLFADADGDGVPDARWTYAPLPPSNGLTFVAAYRIIDNSAKADINTWTAADTGATDQQAPRWYWPGDLDLRAAVTADIDSTFNSGTGDPNIVLDQIFTNADTRGFPAFPNFASRYSNWLLASRQYGDPESSGTPSIPDVYTEIGSALEREVAGMSEDFSGAASTFDRIELDNEAELTWRHGLNRSSDNITADPATRLETSTGATAELENYWRQDSTAIETEFGNAMIDGGGYDEYIQSNPRLRLTTLSGDSERDRVHLNHTETNGDIVDSNVFLSRVEQQLAGGKDLNADFPPISTLGIWENENEFFQRFAAVAYDFRDGGNGSPTTNPDPDQLTAMGSFYGMEYLPFISEVYVQARYELAAANPSTTIPGTFRWELQENSGVRAVEVAIELTNPWPFPIRVNPLAELVIRDTDASGDIQNWGTLAAMLLNDNNDITGVTQITAGGDVVLMPNAVVTLLLNDVDTEETSNITANNLTSVYGNNIIDLNTISLGFTPEWPEDVANRNEQGDVVLELQMPTTTGIDPAVYQRFESHNFPDEWETNSIGPLNAVQDAELAAFPANVTGYVQFATVGTANGFAVMTVDARDTTVDRIDPGTAANSVFNVSMPHPSSGTSNGVASAPTNGTDVWFGIAEKTQMDSNNLDIDSRVSDGLTSNSGTPPVEFEPFLIPSSEVIYRSGDLFRMVLLGPSAPITKVGPGGVTETVETVAEHWKLATENVIAAGARPRGGTPREFRIRDFMIDPYELYNGAANSNFAAISPDPIYANAGAMPGEDLEDAVSWGAFFLDQVTTLSPDRDGVDNDGDNRTDHDSGDDDENLIPGRINLNTITPDALTRALPMAPVVDTFSDLLTTDTKFRLINEILTAREDPSATGNYKGRVDPSVNPDQRGIAYLGELFGGQGGLGALAAGEGNTPAFLDLTNTGVGDFNEYEQGVLGNTSFMGLKADGSAGSIAHDLDDRTGDLEERTLGLSYLNQVASVRSDVFTVYVLVRGYPTGNFGQNGYSTTVGGVTVAEPSEEYRLVFTMDRSVVHEDRPQPRVISVARFNQN